MFESKIFAGATEKQLCSGNMTRISSPMTWSHAKKCVERYCELANKTTQQLHKVTTPRMDNHQFKEEEMGSVGQWSLVCAQIVVKCLYLARIGRSDILWSVNKLARAVTKWTRICGKRLVRAVSCIHNMSDHRQYCHVGNTAQRCRFGTVPRHRLSCGP